MALSPDQFAELNRLVVAAFNEQSLETMMRLKLGVILFKELVGHGLPFNDLVLQVTSRLEERGLTANFMKAVLEARPEAAELQEKLTLYLASVSDHTAVANVQVTAVTVGVSGLAGQLQLVGVRTVVAASEGFLTKLADDILLLRAYKSLHDALHFLQMLLRSLATAARTIATDPVAMGDLLAAITQLQTLQTQIEAYIRDLPEVPPAVRAVETIWLTRLANAIALGQQCLDTLDPVSGRRCVFEVRSLLRQEPPRIDAVLSLTAGSLDLGRLKGVFADAAAAPGVPPDLAVSLEKSQLAAEQLLRQLGALLNQHADWQWIDRNFWEAEDNLPKSAATDPGDFNALWMGIEERLRTLLQMEPTSEWAQSILKHVEALAAARKLDDWTRSALEFMQVRQRCIVQFFATDTNLKTLAGEVAGIGASLRRLVQGL